MLLTHRISCNKFAFTVKCMVVTLAKVDSFPHAVLEVILNCNTYQTLVI